MVVRMTNCLHSCSPCSLVHVELMLSYASTAEGQLCGMVPIWSMGPKPSIVNAHLLQTMQ